MEAGNIHVLGGLQDELQCLTHHVVPVVREVGDIGEVLYNCRGERTGTIVNVDSLVQLVRHRCQGFLYTV